MLSTQFSRLAHTRVIRTAEKPQQDSIHLWNSEISSWHYMHQLEKFTLILILLVHLHMNGGFLCDAHTQVKHFWQSLWNSFFLKRRLIDIERRFIDIVKVCFTFLWWIQTCFFPTLNSVPALCLTQIIFPPNILLGVKNWCKS